MTVPDIWSVTEDVSQFKPVFLFFDVVAVGALGLIAAVAFEAWRRWHGAPTRFSLRSAMVGVAVCSLFFAWIHYRVARRESQRPAIAQLERAGATIVHESILPDWLRELLSDEVGRPFDDVVMVDLPSSKFSSDDLKNLSLFPDLQSLDLDHSGISDADLLHIAKLQKLRWLSLAGTATTDCGLEHLQQLTNLKTLILDNTRIRGPGLKYLQQLTKLESLSVRDTPLTDDGLRYLVSLPSLSYVQADGTQISMDGADDFQEQSQRHLTIDNHWRTAAGRRKPSRAILEDSTMEGFVKTPLCDAIDYLTDLHNIEFKWDEIAIEDPNAGGRPIGVVKDLPVTMDRTGTLHDLLARVLQEKGLAFLVEADWVLITTPAVVAGNRSAKR